MTFRQFEREFLRLAFTTPVELTPSSMAFVLDLPVVQAERHMHTLVDQGVLELISDDDGRLSYDMPDRSETPMSSDFAIAAQALQMNALVPYSQLQPYPQSSGHAVLSLALNAAVCPGVGTLVGGRTAPGIAQLSMFLLGLPLAVFTIGVPLMIAAWLWGIASGVRMLSEARD